MHQDLQQTPPHELPRGQQAQYLDDLITRTVSHDMFGLGLTCHENGIYICVDRTHGTPNTQYPGKELLREVTADTDRVLTPRELSMIIEEERCMYSLHVNIPPERRLAFIQDLLAAKTSYLKALVSLQKGHLRPTPANLKGAGSQLSWIGDWKVIGLGDPPEGTPTDTDGHSFPDFVFTIEGKTPQEAEAMMTNLAAELSPIVRKYEDSDGIIPPFSQLVRGPDGYKHTSFSYTQGTKPFKYYLQRTSRLNDIFEAEQNYAVMKKSF